jgi:hypothetical protein
MESDRIDDSIYGQQEYQDGPAPRQYYEPPVMMAPPMAPPPPPPAPKKASIFDEIDKNIWIMIFIAFILGFFMGKTMQPVILRQ